MAEGKKTDSELWGCDEYRPRRCGPCKKESRGESSDSVQRASAEYDGKPCGLCQRRGRDKEATHFCEDCNEYLCGNCSYYSHKHLGKSEDHNILLINQIQKKCGVCTCNEKNEITDFCENHFSVFCNFCRTSEHRSCKTVSVTRKCANYCPERLHVVLSKIKQLKRELGNLCLRRNSDLQLLKTMKAQCKEEIINFRAKLNNTLDKFQDDLLAELDEKECEIHHSVNQHIETMSTMLALLSDDFKVIEDAKKDGRKKAMFAAEVKILTGLKEYESIHCDIEIQAFTPNLGVKLNEMLTNIQQRVDKFGAIYTNSSDNDVRNATGKRPLIDMKVLSSSSVDVELKTDKETPCISGCAFMSSGELVICDKSNKKVKLLDQLFAVINDIVLDSAPHDVSVVDDTNIIVTLPEQRQLQYIQVLPHLKMGRKIQLNVKGFGIEVFSNEIFVTYCSRHVGKILRLDSSGNIKHAFVPKQDGFPLFCRPFYLSVSKSGKRLYVSDFGASWGLSPIPSTLHCITFAGSKVYAYQDKNLRGSKGVYVDEGDNVLIISELSNEVHLVTKNGTKQRKPLLSDRDGIRDPQCIAVRQTDDILVIGCWNNRNLYRFKLMGGLFTFRQK